MDKLLAVSIIAIALVYAEPLRGGMLFGYLLPLAALLSIYFLFRVTGSLILLVMLLSYHFMDVSSSSIFFSVVLPLVLGLTLILLGIWAWKREYLHSESGWFDSGGGGDGFGGGDCGGDGGGC